MPVVHTLSSTPLESITIERLRDNTAHVWLRRNIEETTIDFEGKPTQIWHADEIYTLMNPAPTLAEVEEDFTRLWALNSYPRPEESTEERLTLIETAIAELGDIIGGL